MSKRKERKISEDELLEMLPQDELRKAIKFYKEFHWGIPMDKMIAVDKPEVPNSMVFLGYLRGVLYQTTKKDDGKDTFYFHSFSPDKKDKFPFPILACDASARQLFIVGGRYHIEGRGIVN